jgi:soluble lytic murein transglycosylase-like protein
MVIGRQIVAKTMARSSPSAARGGSQNRSAVVQSARSARVRAMRIACTLLLLAELPLAAGSSAAAAPASPAAAAYAVPVREAAQRFAIPEIWIWRVMYAESRGRPRAISHAGAMGLMQIMPGTWAMLTSRHRLGADPFDARANIHAGAAYLRAMWDRYGDVRLMLAAYNAGPGRVDAYAAGRQRLPAETIAYVTAIAPEIGASSVAPLPPAPSSRARAWRSASLFAARAETANPNSAAAVPLHGRRSPAAPEAPGRQPASSLFVPLSGTGQ